MLRFSAARKVTAPSRFLTGSLSAFSISCVGYIRLDPLALADTPVEDGERLARVVLTNKHVRKESMTPKPEAFLPFKHVELSVIRHRELNEGELWEIGYDVAAKRGRPLVGRADFTALNARLQNLDVVPSEGPELPRNHANIVGWPSEKPAQMLRAVELAAAATFVEAPAPAKS